MKSTSTTTDDAHATLHIGPRRTELWMASPPKIIAVRVNKIFRSWGKKKPPPTLTAFHRTPSPRNFYNRVSSFRLFLIIVTLTRVYPLYALPFLYMFQRRGKKKRRKGMLAQNFASVLNLYHRIKTWSNNIRELL